MSSMTAEQVWALIQGWPIEARDKHIELRRGCFAVAYFSDRDGNAVEVETVINASVGSGLAWLVARGITRLDPVGDTWRVCRPMDEYGDNWYRWDGATKLEALSAAILAAAKEGA